MPSDWSSQKHEPSPIPDVGLEQHSEREDAENILPIGVGDSAEGVLPARAKQIVPALTSTQQSRHKDHTRPPLPPRPTNLSLLQAVKTSSTNLGNVHNPATQLQSTATTAVSHTDIQTQAYHDGSHDAFAATAEPKPPLKPPQTFGSIKGFKRFGGSESGDTASIKSLAPTSGRSGDNESLLGDVLGTAQEQPAWKLFGGEKDTLDPSGLGEGDIDVDFYQEFDDIQHGEDDSENEEERLRQWKSKRKHFLILSSAGKPIYSRHGDDQLISTSIGVIHTIISFYEDSQNKLTGFSAAGSRFVISSQGSLYLVAISKLGENDVQLRAQLDALYMQVLSTLTLPTLNHLFVNRPSTDLRRPLKGTEVLLSSLADSFTRGSPPALLSALECLTLKKLQRQAINDALLRHKCESLLYGLIVAGGRLVSVARPRKHSLHPSDLQLIFNMLFEADGIKAGGGENWIPLCLPAFNKNGYLYMYVSFVSASQGDNEEIKNVEEVSDIKDTIAVLLISANKESFYDLQNMRNLVVQDLEKSGSMESIRSAVRAGRPTSTDIVPGTVVRHFLYKSRSNVQYFMPSYEPEYTTLFARRKLLSLYHTLHANVHAKNSHLKVQHCISRSSISLAWVTPTFELYCAAGPSASRNALTHSANKVVQYMRREEERVFIIGGAVF
ncbi:uncharacterized protein KY384_002579 [Bacidia gigantensis]|uniref:uncharacterized protein n=1 Tax=Bacidia gigantensis TaxID=2732470 RepID=UPI001D03F7E5|nr:uncharacterized protein KY384_002579 [Bacidia gigantensis]KAG8532702.1 hypothetical protein KY384_002579 [Bacidia gigantensis]